VINVYAGSPTGLVLAGGHIDEEVAQGIVWIDLLTPTRDEEQHVEAALGVDLPTREEMAEIEDSSRFYEENDALYLTASITSRSESDVPTATDVTFVLTRNRLVTLRYEDPRPFRTFVAQAERHAELCTSGEAVLLGLLDACLDRIADLIERAGGELDSLVHEVLTQQRARGRRRRTGVDHATLLSRLERNQALVAKARVSLLSLNRLINFLARPKHGITRQKALNEQVRMLVHDVRSLVDHINYLAGNISFELQAILGMVSIQQNDIIKIFSVAAVVFLPPTLVASVYGMNFDHMPELRWLLGYPFALLLMIGSAILPYLWFKYRGWL
jgi:magnesium transporter